MSFWHNFFKNSLKNTTSLIFIPPAFGPWILWDWLRAIGRTHSHIHIDTQVHMEKSGCFINRLSQLSDEVNICQFCRIISSMSYNFPSGTVQGKITTIHLPLHCNIPRHSEMSHFCNHPPCVPLFRLQIHLWDQLRSPTQNGRGAPSPLSTVLSWAIL